MSKNCDLKVRVTEEMRARMDAAVALNVYKLSVSQIIERGIELALDELDKMNAAIAQVLEHSDD